MVWLPSLLLGYRQRAVAGSQCADRTSSAGSVFDPIALEIDNSLDCITQDALDGLGEMKPTCWRALSARDEAGFDVMIGWNVDSSQHPDPGWF